ncbi:MAG: UDP-2,4-diacetamido-2,4,6-trideoxy-beta-L-altropyranose hydrolase, partial [Comamonadaceae bacterium]
MRVAIRADASASLGTGHLRRCLALARAVAACGAEVLFLSRDTDGVAAGVLRGQPFGVHWLQGGEGDTVQCIDALAAAPPAWTIVDHYGLDSDWHDALRSRLGCRIAVVDDLADRALAPDLLIDHNDPDAAQTYAQRLTRPCAFLAGPAFALLDTLYATAPRYRFNEQVRSIGIFMGGTDPHGHCLAALLACRESLGFSGAIEVVCSPASPSHAALALACARWPGATLRDGLPDLAAFFARHDLQIGAGGGAVWERCCIGVPAIACVAAPNQLSTVPRLAALGAVAWAQEDGAGTQEAIAAQLRLLLAGPALRRGLGESAARLVDGQGSARVAAVLACAAGAPLRARPADAGDELLLLDWANDPVVRANAFQPEAVLPQQHSRWFAARLADSAGCRIVILEAPNGVPVGQVRLEWREHAWEIGYSMAAPYRGHGLAATLLGTAIATLPAGDAVLG